MRKVEAQARREKLRALVEKGLSTADIAERMNMRPENVTETLNRMGLRAKTRSSS